MATALVTGGTSNFGQQLVAELGPGSHGIGRGNGWDLKDKEAAWRVAEESLKFDIFVNYAFLGGFQQTEFLQRVAEQWKSKNKPGLIVNFGSYKTFCNRHSRSDYVLAKTALDEASRQWAKLGEAEEIPFRVTCLRLGYLQMEKNVGKPFFPGYGIDAATVAKWIQHIDQVPQFSVPELVINIRARGKS